MTLRQPMPAPHINELIKNLDQQDIANAVVAVSGSREARYLHWDEFRYKTPPKNVSTEAWWFAVKIARMGTQRKLDLKDNANKPFVFNLPDVVLQDIEFVSERLKGTIGFGERVTNPATRDQYLVSSLIEEAITSSQLEGATTSRRVANQLIRSGREPRDRSERMIVNNFYAMERVGDLRGEPLTLDTIQELHRIVTDGTLDDPDAAGRFQKPGEERVKIYDSEDNVLYYPPPAEEIEERLQKLCDFANTETSGQYFPGVLKALTIHFMIGYIHPFEDGNGRTARILFYWSMLNQGYWLTEFISVSRLLKKAQGKYARSFLYTETDGSDLTYFYVYHLGIIRRSINALYDYLAREMAQLREVRQLLAKEQERYNGRQMAVIQHALKDPEYAFSVDTHMRSHRIGAETARKDLQDLESSGVLVKTKSGRKFVFLAAPNLAKSLRDRAAQLPN
ncbi:Fic family protein [Catelliglobosispora koreensis]|uniref:Fic family protein n=1 Tax=Catelliglobosispora koreensis TaxID=129052 RepID=UPI0003A0B2D8|nr:Fic family protein [Catelliglobosispora koreensis]